MKFTTEDAGGDGARVAKFGAALNVAGDMFATTYNSVTGTQNKMLSQMLERMA